MKLDRIVAYPITNTQTALMRYESGELDWISSLPAPRLPKLKNHPHYHKSPYLGIYFYRFNCTKKPFDDTSGAPTADCDYLGQYRHRHLLRCSGSD